MKIIKFETKGGTLPPRTEFINIEAITSIQVFGDQIFIRAGDQTLKYSAKDNKAFVDLLEQGKTVIEEIDLFRPLTK